MSAANHSTRTRESWFESLAILERFGLSRPELRAWAMYDWAISAVQTTVMTAVFPIFYLGVAAGAGLSSTTAADRWATLNGISVVLVAVFSPVLGVIADYAAVKKRMLAAWMAIGILACGGMYFIGHGDVMLASLLFIAASIAAAGATVFYDALLPHIASVTEVDRVSAAAYAVGYFGGGLLLAVNLAMIQRPDWFGIAGGDATLPVRLAMVSAAAWWLLFSIPLFHRIPEPRRRLEVGEDLSGSVLRVTQVRVLRAFRELRGYPQALLMLLAFLLYNDGIATIQRIAAAYGTDIGFEPETLIGAFLVVQFVGVPATFMFGRLAARVGTRPMISVGLIVYCGVTVLACFMRTAAHVYVLAGLVGLVQGGTQALSRSLFATLIPRQKSGEFFGFYSVFNKFGGVLGSFLFATIGLSTGSNRTGILSVIVFFIGGGVLLMLVDVDEGRRVARVERIR